MLGYFKFKAQMPHCVESFVYVFCNYERLFACS